MINLSNLSPTPEQISRTLNQTCNCQGFQNQNGILFDSQELYSQGREKCPCCLTAFKKGQPIKETNLEK